MKMSPLPLLAPAVSTVTGGGSAGAAAEAGPATASEAGIAPARSAAAAVRQDGQDRRDRAGRLPRANDLVCMGVCLPRRVTSGPAPSSARAPGHGTRLS